MLFQACYQDCPWGAFENWTAAVATLQTAVEVMQPERTTVTFLLELKQRRPDTVFALSDGVHTFSLVSDE